MTMGGGKVVHFPGEHGYSLCGRMASRWAREVVQVTIKDKQKPAPGQHEMDLGDPVRPVIGDRVECHREYGVENWQLVSLDVNCCNCLRIQKQRDASRTGD